MRRRRVRRYRPGKENSVMKFAVIFGIILCAVVCGYMTARFALGPLLGYDTEVLKLDVTSKLAAGLEQDKKSYVLQFGVFSAESGARELKAQLKKDGIETTIKEEDGKYKVISDAIETKEEALKQLETLKDENNIDVFIDAEE